MINHLGFEILRQEYISSLDIFVDDSPTTVLVEVRESLGSAQCDLESGVPIQLVLRPCKYLNIYVFFEFLLRRL